MAPCVVLADEIDSMCTRKEMLNQETEKRILNLFINLLDQVNTYFNLLIFLDIILKREFFLSVHEYLLN